MPGKTGRRGAEPKLKNGSQLFPEPNHVEPCLLRLFLVTPEMRRVRHSIHSRETNSNFGFNMPWWDYLFGTYRPQPVDGHERMTIGLEQFREEAVADRLHWMLALPFIGPIGRYPLSWHGDRPSDPGVVHAPEPVGAGRSQGP
jgi:hypothetical protein